jgi:hypothetical protein
MLLANGAVAEQVFIDHCKHGCPIASNGEEILVVRHLFASSMNDDGVVRWLAYRVFADTVGVASLFPRAWQSERLIGAPTAAEVDSSPRFVQPNLENSQDREYRVNEIRLLDDERGRLAPMTSFANTPYLSELNLLSNMALLPADLRLGPWSRLDQAVNEQSAHGGYFFVVTGPLMAGSQLDAQPTQFFKVIAQNNQLAAFLFPAASAPHVSFCQYQVSFDELERLTQVSFFPEFDAVWSEDLAAKFGCPH